MKSSLLRQNMLAVLIVAPVVLSVYVGHLSSGSVGLVLALCAAYFVPTIVARRRKVPNQGSVLVINLFLGWTLVGWVVALAMAVRSRVMPAGESLTR